LLISDEHKFIFIHIPKTAGSSIRSALSEFALERNNSQLSRLLRRFNLPKNHHNYRFGLHNDLRKAQEKIPAELFSQYRKVAFVRNPWDQLASNYRYKVFGSSDKKSELSNIDFESFIQKEAKRHNRLQHDYLIDRNRKLQCDFLGRFENLAEDYNKLRDFLGIDLVELPSKNISLKKGSYQDYYNDETKEFVAQHWKKDIDVFGYEF